MAGFGWHGWKILAVGAFACAAILQVACAQTAASAPADAGVSLAAYDVVSVKAVQPGTRMEYMGVRNMPDGIDAENVTVSVLVRTACGGFSKLPTDDSVTGLPDWAKAEYFNVQAKMNAEQAAAFAKLDKDAQEEQREAMLRALLAEGFKLKEHREPKTVPDYELVVAKGGPKLKEGSDTNPNGPKDRDGKPMTGPYMIMSGTGKVSAQQFTMQALANFLGQPMVGVGRVVKDKTGLTGKYSFILNFSPPRGFKAGPDAGAFPPGPEDENPSIFTALQEDLGLKLQPGTATIDMVVVEHVERPAAD